MTTSCYTRNGLWLLTLLAEHYGAGTGPCPTVASLNSHELQVTHSTQQQLWQHLQNNA